MCQKCRDALKIRKIRSVSYSPSQQDFKYLDGVIYGLDYAENPEIQAAIKQFKYKFTQDLVDYFGKILAEKLGQLRMVKDKQVTLIPVPLHKKRQWQRGFNQAQLIAENVAKRMGDLAQVDLVLIRIKHTSQQAKLNKAERHKNLLEAFEISGDLEKLDDKICFLVDDVCTTGATLDSCAKLLKEKGVFKVYGLVVARAFK